MAHYYVGVDAPGSPVIPLVVTPGKGVWPAAQLTDDQDDRDAASANLGAEASHDKTNFLAWRMINIIEGGTYAYTSSITIRNAFTFTGPNVVWGASASWAFWAPASVALDATFYVGDPSGFAGAGHIVVKDGSDITVNGPSAKIQLTAGADFEANNGSVVRIQNGGSLSIDSASSATLAGTTTQTGPFFQSGDNGWHVKRHVTVSNGAVIADARAYDIIQLGDIGNTGSTAVSCSITLSQPPNDAEVGITVRVFVPRGKATAGTSSDYAYFTVNSTGTDAGGTGKTSIDGSGKTEFPCFVDLEIVEASGGTQRKWVATASSSKTA